MRMVRMLVPRGHDPTGDAFASDVLNRLCEENTAEPDFIVSLGDDRIGLIWRGVSEFPLRGRRRP